MARILSNLKNHYLSKRKSKLANVILLQMMKYFTKIIDSIGELFCSSAYSQVTANSQRPKPQDVVNRD